MADSPTDQSLLERLGGRRLLGVSLGAAAIALLALAGWAFGRRPAEAVASGALEPPPGRLVVEVLNGTDTDGLARRTTRWLRGRGLDVVAYGNADASATTRLLVRRGPPSRGYEARRALGIGEVEVAVDTMLRVDVTVILGSDFALPADAPPF